MLLLVAIPAVGVQRCARLRAGDRVGSEGLLHGFGFPGALAGNSAFSTQVLLSSHSLHGVVGNSACQESSG